MQKTLLLKKHSFYTARVHRENRRYYDADDIGGTNLVNFFQQHCRAGSLATHKDTTLQFSTVDPVGSHGLLVQVASGEGGRTGAVIDSTTQSIAMSLDPAQHVSAIGGLMLLVVPPGRSEAFTFLERDRGQCPGIPCLEYLSKQWRSAAPGVTWNQEWIVMGSQFLAEANLKAIEIKRTNDSVSTAQSGQTVIATRTFGAVAPRGKFLPRAVADAMLAHKISAHDVLSMDEDDRDETCMSLQLDGITKRFWLDRGSSMPKVQPEIQVVTIDDFIEECQTYAESLDGLDWDRAWLR